jgi:DNA-binding GntR family transcriptional regulator
VKVGDAPMPRKLERPAPPYLQIADDIRRSIRNGDLAPGERAPSVREIVRTYDVAMATAHRAVRALQSEGFVRTLRGVGNVVTDERERGWSPSAWLEKARTTGRVYPPGHRARILSTELVEAGDQVAGALGVEVGAPVVRRARVRSSDTRPVSLSTSWYPAAAAEVAPRLLEADRIEEGTFAYVAWVLGRRVSAWQDQYEAGLLTPAQARDLQVPEGTAAVLGRNWVYDNMGEVLEYGESATISRITYRGEVDHA